MGLSSMGSGQNRAASVSITTFFLPRVTLVVHVVRKDRIAPAEVYPLHFFYQALKN